MSFTSKPIRNLVIPLIALLLGLWLRPILQRLPAPQLPRVELTSLDGARQSADSCQVANDLAGGVKYCEDVVHWPEAGLAIISCDAGRPEWNTVMGPLKTPAPHGSLYAYPLADRTSASAPRLQHGFYRLELKGFPSTKDFHPLGVEIHPSGPHSATLFVINHRRDRSVIEVFGLKNVPQDEERAAGTVASLKWHRTLAHDLIWTPNSIVALGPNSLLVTNDHFINRRAHPFLHILETWLALPGGNVIAVEFQDGLEASSSDPVPHEQQQVQARTVISRISFANGLALSPDGLTLVVASSMSHALYYYHHAPSGAPADSPHFVFVGTRPLSFAPDNISFYGARQLVVAGHPHGLTLLKFTRNMQHATPPGSWAVIVSHPGQAGPLDPSRASVQNVFRDDGTYFGSSATAIIVSPSSKRAPENSEDTVRSARLLVSGLYENGLLECDI